MKVALATIALLAHAAPADAHQCHGFCPNEGHEYVPSIFSLELGIVTSQIPVSISDAQDSGLSAGMASATGGQYRFLGGLHGIYLGGELTLFWLDEPAGARTAPRTITEPARPGGRSEEMRAIVGVRRSSGALLVGAELSGGMRFLRIHDAPEGVAALHGLVDARVTGGVWLSPYVSVAINAGVGLVREDEYSAALMLGVHPFPWDGLR